MRVTATERRIRFRAMLQREELSRPATVFDPLSAELAQLAGFEFGLLGGSIASAVVLGAPDHVVLTLTELADLCRRIGRYSSLPIMVDADHGYGNALNVQRTVEELEDAGVAALSIEDTLLPQRFGSSSLELISPEEFQGKLGAARGARLDENFVIAGRTLVQPVLADTLERVAVCDAAGVDAVFLIGGATEELLRGARQITQLPLFIGGLGALTEAQAVAYGARISATGHPAFQVVLNALFDCYRGLLNGEAPSRQMMLPEDVRRRIYREADYDSVLASHMRIESWRVGRA